MDLQKFALRLLFGLVGFALLLFWLEAGWDFYHAVNPQTGQPLQLADLHVTPEMARAVASPFARAYNNIIALLLTFISLAIPLTANLYTPKLIEIFVRDKLNLFVLCVCALLAAHSLFSISLTFNVWTPQLPFWVNGIGAMLGWLLLMPYYFYVLSFIDPLTIIKRIHLSLMTELRDAAAGRYPVAEAQSRVNQRIINLGSMLQRSVDRADRDVAFDAIRAHTLDLARVRQIKPKLSPAFFQVSSSLMFGMSSEATDVICRERTWMEHRIASQLVLAFKIALVKMPEAVGALVHAIKNATHEEAVLRNDEVFHLLVRVFNTFMREAIKKKENAPVYNVIYNYKTLIRRLLKDRPELVAALIHHLGFYAEFARGQGMTFIYELISYELVELAEVAYDQGSDNGPRLLAAVLDFKDVGRHAGLVKSRVILAGYFAERGLTTEQARVEDSLQEVPGTMLETSRHGIMTTLDPVFWEINHRGTNFDYVADARRDKVGEVFARLLNAAS